MTTIQRKSRILDELHETVRGLHTSGLISAHRMAEYDALREGGGEDMPPEKIKRLQEKEHLSQADLDTVLNTSISTIQKWGIAISTRMVLQEGYCRSPNAKVSRLFCNRSIPKWMPGFGHMAVMRNKKIIGRQTCLFTPMTVGGSVR
jgi:putative transcriptional regulator